MSEMEKALGPGMTVMFVDLDDLIHEGTATLDEVLFELSHLDLAFEFREWLGAQIDE